METASQLVLIKRCDMDKDQKAFAVQTVVKASNKCSTNANMAIFIKREFDTKFQPRWHCIVGNSFGYDVEFEPGHLISMITGHTNVVIYKSNKESQVQSDTEKNPE